MNINPVSVIKFVAAGIVGLGTSKIVGKIIKDHVQPETVIEKAAVVAATWVISGIATRATKDFTNETIDDVVEAGSKIKKSFQQNKILARVNRGEIPFSESGLSIDEFELVNHGEEKKWVRTSTKVGSK